MTNYFYFSDENIKKVKKNRLDLSLNLNKNLNHLPLLSDDTSNIIEYFNDEKNIKKIKKRSFWDLLN